MTAATAPERAGNENHLPLRPRLVLRAGFAGVRDFEEGDESRIRESLDAVLTAIGEELTRVSPNTPAKAKHQIPVASFFQASRPLLRLVTGMDKGADLLAGSVLRSLITNSDDDREDKLAIKHLDRELAAVIPFDVDTYRATRELASPAEFDRQLEECKWILLLDGKYEKPTDAYLAGLPSESARLEANAFGDRCRSRAYRAQAAMLLRHSDLFIAAANPDAARKSGGTLETVREAQVFELPVVFINSKTGGIHLLAPEDDVFTVLAVPADRGNTWREKLQSWVRQLTVDPNEGAAAHSEHDQTWEHGSKLLEEFFDHGDSPRIESARRTRKLRKDLWSWFESRFRQGELEPEAQAPIYRTFRSRASELSNHYGALYRGAFFLNYVLAICAVFLAVMSLALIAGTPRDEGHLPSWLFYLLLVMALVKLGIVRSIAHNTKCANENQWNDRAVDFRYLAERLRAMNFLPAVGSQQPPTAGQRKFATRVVRQSAMDWLFDSIVRAVSPADLARAQSGNDTIRGNADVPADGPIVVELAPVAAAKKVRDGWIYPQAVYHDRNSRTMKGMDHAIEVLSFSFSNVVWLVVVADIIIVLLEIWHWVPSGFVQVATVATLVLISISALLPAIVAALGGTRFQSECRRLGDRSALTRSMLSGWSTSHGAHHLPKETLKRLRAHIRAFWLVIRQLFLGYKPAYEKMQVRGGRHALVSALIARIEQAQGDSTTDIGSWSHDVLRMTEVVATDFVLETAEWSVLYAREVSDPG